MMPNYTPLDLLIVVYAVVAMPVLSAVAARRLARTPRTELNLVRRYWFIIARGVLVSLLILFAWRWAGRPYSALGLDIPIDYWGRMGFGFDAVLVCSYTIALLSPKSAERRAHVRRRMERIRIMPQTREEFLLFPLVAISGSVMEELLARGFLIWFITPFAGLWGAALLSSVLFGLLHAYQGWFGILRTALIGLAFAIAYVLTRSLWWLMLAHVALNLFGGLYAWRLMRESPAPAQ
jgi:uncharacterized protein